MNNPSARPVADPSAGAIDTVSALAVAQAEIAELRVLLEDSRAAEAAARAGEAAADGALEFRIRNMLAIVRSLFSRTLSAGGSLDEVADHFRGRFDVFARYQTGAGRPDGGRDLQVMLWDELHSFEFDDRVTTTGPDTRIPDETALTVALAIHELVTNSIKFGALSHATGEGRVAIVWTLDGMLLNLRWEETGVPIVTTAPVKRGFGREFIEHALPYQLDTDSSFELRPGGVVCTMIVPLTVRDRRGIGSPDR